MADLFDYLSWRGDLPLTKSPFNQVDAAVLCLLAYAPFRELGDRMREGIPAGEACSLLAALPNLDDLTFLPVHARLIRALPHSPRFADMTLHRHEDFFDAETEIQFSAVTVRMGEGLWFVAFRGTDGTLVGWKEDFNMTFRCPIPAQEAALRYLSRCGDLPGVIIPGGHSKGGNLAVYAASLCDPALQSRFPMVYDLDGPGFPQEFLDRAEYKRLKGRIRKIVPQDSIVGMMMGHDVVPTIVQAEAPVSMLQHDMGTWQLMRTRFETLDSVSDSSLRLDNTLKGWLRELTPAQRETFIETVYSALEQSGITDLRHMEDVWIPGTRAILEQLRDLDEETREVIKQVFHALVRATKASRSMVTPAEEARAAEKAAEKAEKSAALRTRLDEVGESAKKALDGMGKAARETLDKVGEKLESKKEEKEAARAPAPPEKKVAAVTHRPKDQK